MADKVGSWAARTAKRKYGGVRPGGAGSRGGKVIGYSKGGHPIYAPGEGDTHKRVIVAHIEHPHGAKERRVLPDDKGHAWKVREQFHSAGAKVRLKYAKAHSDSAVD